VRTRSRRRSLAFGLIVAVIVAIIAVQGLAGFYTNFLWFHWNGVGGVWSTVTTTKIVITVTFIVVAFAVMYASLLLVDRVVARTLFMGPDTEFVRRYQAVIGPHVLALRITVSVLVALAIGSGTSSQWQNWLLFEHAVRFKINDPVFGRDVSFFVFRLPFLSFLVDWMFGLLIVVLIVTAIAYFINGALRLQGGIHVEPRAIAHLSLILSLMALERAWAFYFVDRFGLELSHNGVVEGMSYTDLHVRVPAIEFLAVVSLIAFVMLAFNVYQRTLVLPAISGGLWIFLALGIGVIFPSLFQALRVTPAQNRLELSSIQRNIAATTYAMGIGKVDAVNFPANQDLTANVLAQYKDTLDDVQLWDPNFSKATFTKLQALFPGYNLTDLAIDRYTVGGKTTPVVIGARSLNSSGLLNQSWVSTHLQYTQGYGAIIARANTNGTSTNGGGNPQFLLSNVPQQSKDAKLLLKSPGVYFAPGDEQYVIANSGHEVGYEDQNGNIANAPAYKGDGIPVDSLLSRVSFALHLHDFNLLVSNQITPKSKLIEIPDVRAEVQKAVPFLSVDAHPYAVDDNGSLKWLVDAYVTSDSYPFAQTAPTDAVSPGSGLSGTFNYVRDSLKVVVDAYSGKMSFYSIGTPDPILRAYEQIFPGLIHPLSSLEQSDPTLLQHLRYPQDLLTVQAEAYGRYHVTAPSDFYARSAAWNLAQTSDGVGGSPSQNLPTTDTGAEARFTPIYELLQLQGGKPPTFSAVEPLVPYSSDDKLKILSAIFVANSSYAGYGDFTSLDTPYQETQIDGPGLANADINANPTVSEAITLLDKGGSSVTLGTLQILPIADSLLYVRPLYVSSSQTAYPLLQDVLVVYGSQVTMAPTLSGALEEIFGSGAASAVGSTQPSGGSGSTAVPVTVREEIASAVTEYTNARAALSKGDLGTYQSDVDAAGRLLKEANQTLITEGVKPVTPASTKTTTKSSVATTSTTVPTKASVSSTPTA
jgi:uncharacterized membrane protein (UPF0182 family)